VHYFGLNLKGFRLDLMHHVFASLVRVHFERQELSDLGQRETERLCPLDEPQTE